MSNKYKFYVHGTHCHSCKVLIEDIIGSQKGVSSVNVNLHHECLEAEGEMCEDPNLLAQKWSELLAPHNYKLSVDPIKKNSISGDMAYALPLGLFILGLFFLLQRLGIVNFGVEGHLTPSTAFLIGVIASLSSCLAVVGGLVLSLSAEVSKDVSSMRPFVFFHSGRIVSFLILGGILGFAGGALAVSGSVVGILGIVAALVMIILGLNLLDILRITKKFQLALPRDMFDKFSKMERGFFAPFFVGVGTFFLPCGFTQSMQIAALSSGSFWSGSMIMTSFVLGTLPVLAALSFGSFAFAHSKYAQLFFRTAGIVVVGLGIFALLGSLAGLGIINPLFNI